MPKGTIVYELETEINEKPDYDEGEYYVSAKIVDGKVRIRVEYPTTDEYLLGGSADASGDKQSDMLWEIFDHSFAILDEKGQEVEYDE